MFSFWRRYVIIKIIELRLIHNYSLLRISLSMSVLIIECNSHRYQLVIIVVSILKMGKLRLRIVKSHSRSHWDQSGKDYSSRPRNFFPWAVTNWYLLLIFFFLLLRLEPVIWKMGDLGSVTEHYPAISAPPSGFLLRLYLTKLTRLALNSFRSPGWSSQLSWLRSWDHRPMPPSSVILAI